MFIWSFDILYYLIIKIVITKFLNYVVITRLLWLFIMQFQYFAHICEFWSEYNKRKLYISNLFYSNSTTISEKNSNIQPSKTSRYNNAFFNNTLLVNLKTKPSFRDKIQKKILVS